MYGGRKYNSPVYSGGRDEENLSAQCSQEKKDARLSQEDEHEGRSGDNKEEKAQGEKRAQRLTLMRKIKKRKDFQEVFRAGKTWRYRNFLATYLRVGEDEAFFGFSTPKSLGGSVVRNRARRRLREAVRKHERGFPPGRYVFRARKSTLNCDFQELESELERFQKEIGGERQ